MSVNDTRTMPLFYTLPENQRITIRDVDTALRKLVTRVHYRWQGDRVSVVLAKTVHVDGGVSCMGSNTTRAVLVNLVTGTQTIPAVDIERDNGRITWHGYAGQVDPGDALVIFKRKHPRWHAAEDRDLDVTFHLCSFHMDAREREKLDAARDAILQERADTAALKVAQEVLPLSHGLFLALCRRERSLLRTSTEDA
jgi:hypothetical protein